MYVVNVSHNMTEIKAQNNLGGYEFLAFAEVFGRGERDNWCIE